MGGCTEDERCRDRLRIAARGAEELGVGVARHAGARGLGDAAAARVERQAPAAAAPARRPVELHRRVAELAPEPRHAAHEPAVEHDAGAKASAGRQHDERARAPAGAEEPLGERERVHVVVDERREPESLRELRGEGAAGELGYVGHGLADAPRNRVDGAGHPDADPVEGTAETRGLAAELVDQRADHLDGVPRATVTGRHALLEEHLAGGGHGARGDGRPADVDAEEQPSRLHGPAG